MTCSSCGETSGDGARFCGACGTRLRRRCATCDAELADGVRFCEACGAPTEAVGGPAASSRKTVTVLFADLQGSTSLQERMDPESARALMARYYAAMRDVVEGHGGRVVKFVGDGAMVVFGVPEVAEDDARRAVEAGAAMVEAFAELAADVRRERGVEVHLRVGINTGEVVVEENDDDVVGDVVNVAARLEGAAPPGRVLVGDATYRLVRDSAVFSPPRELQVKGRAQPVVARILESLTPAGGRLATAALVGRDEELETLLAALATATETRRAHLLVLLGSPGVGKSRLLAELAARAADRAVVLTGRCREAAAATFGPLEEIVRAAADSAGGIARMLSADPERDRVERALAFLFGDGDPGPPEETFWATRRLLEAAANSRPVVVVIDDVHWAEALLLDLIEHLAEWLRASPVLLIAAARPELRDLRPALVEIDSRPRSVIALEGLDDDGTLRLASELLGGGLPHEVVARVADASGGNPLFVRELVRMLVDDGVLRRDGDRWVAAVETSDVEVPPTISALLSSRIERLRPDERLVLERASVVGHDVIRGALDGLLDGIEPGRRATALEALRRKELLEPGGTYWIDEPVLRFHHALIRDAAYRRLLKETRADLHERVADWIVSKAGDRPEDDDLVGYHLEQAQANRRALSELDEHGRRVASEAARRLSNAARRALHRDDLPAAAALAARALACLDDTSADRAELLLILCEALLETGDVRAGTAAVEELRVRAAGERRLEAWASAFALQLATMTGTADLIAAEEQAVVAAARLDELGDPAGAAKAHRVRASVLARLGRVGDTEAALDAALTAARAAGDTRQVSGVLALAPRAALWGPSPVARAGGRCLDVVRLLRITTGAPSVEAVSLRCQAVLESFRGRADSSRAMLATARATLEDLGLRQELLELEVAAGIVELAAGDGAAAAAHLREAHEGLAAMGIHVDAAQAAALWARAALALGQDEWALELAAAAETVGDADLKTAIAWRAVKGEALARRGDQDAAVELARAAVALAETTDALIDRADALTSLGTVLRLAGDDRGAADALARARALYEEKGATALADRLGPAAPPPVDDAGPELDNAATRARQRINELIVAGRPEELRAVLHPSFHGEDRRPGAEPAVVDVDGALAVAAAAHALGIRSVQSEVVAVRHEVAALVYERAVADGETVFSILTLTLVDEQGLVVDSTTFDPDDLAEAAWQMDRRSSLRSGRSLVPARFNRAGNIRDWDELRRVFHPDVVHIDHRPVSFGQTIGADASIERLQGLAQVLPDHVVVGERTIADGPGLLLSDVRVRPRLGTAGPEVRLVSLMIHDDDHLIRYDLWVPEDLDDAVAAYRQLAGDEVENRAAQVVREALRAIAEGRLERFGDLARPDFEYDDRRRVVAHAFDGRESLGNLWSMMGRDSYELHVVASRGERLALLRVETTFVETGFAGGCLLVNEVDEDGLGIANVLFDDDMLIDALEEIDRRYLAGEGAGHEVVEVSERVLMAYARRDWDAVRAGYQDDAQIVNWERGLSHREGPDEMVAGHRSTVALVPDYMAFVRSFLRLAHTVCLGIISTAGTNAGGGAVAMSRYSVCRCRDGLIDLLEFFPLEQRLQAVARYDELRETEAASLPERASETSAVQLLRRYATAVSAGDLEALGAIVAPEAVLDDRRAGLAWRAEGKAAYLAGLRALVGLDGTLEGEPLATRGDDLVLMSWTWATATGAATEILNVYELQGDQIVAGVTFEADRLADAFDELERRFLAAPLPESE